MAPAVQKSAEEFAGRLKVVKVNVDQAPGISARLGVQSIPTLLLLRQGQIVGRQVGALPENQLLSWIRRLADSAAA
jgi:thioredoxin 2